MCVNFVITIKCAVCYNIRDDNSHSSDRHLPKRFQYLRRKQEISNGVRAARARLAASRSVQVARRYLSLRPSEIPREEGARHGAGGELQAVGIERRSSDPANRDTSE